MSASKPSVVLMGSKPGSVVALETMLARGWDVRCVVVSRTFGYPWVSGPTLEEYATARGIPVVTQRELSRSIEADFVISYMFRYRVQSDVIAMAGRAALNFHAGPLPEFGGWAFYNVAILENSPEYGCTCHYMDDGFDTGPLLRVRRFPIEVKRETALSLEQRAQAEMVRLFVEFCELAESGDPLPKEEQDPAKRRYMSQEEFELLKKIPDGADAEAIDRTARAFWYPPYGCAYADAGGQRIEVVPQIAKDEIAALFHREDYERLRAAAHDEGAKRSTARPPR